MARNDLSANDAFGSLFREARTAEITVLARAGEIVTSNHPVNPVDGDE